MATSDVTETHLTCVGKLIENSNRFLIAVPTDYSEDLRKIKNKGKHVIVRVSPLV